MGTCCSETDPVAALPNFLATLLSVTGLTSATGPPRHTPCQSGRAARCSVASCGAPSHDYGFSRPRHCRLDCRSLHTHRPSALPLGSPFRLRGRRRGGKPGQLVNPAAGSSRPHGMLMIVVVSISMFISVRIILGRVLGLALVQLLLLVWFRVLLLALLLLLLRLLCLTLCVLTAS